MTCTQPPLCFELLVFSKTVSVQQPLRSTACHSSAAVECLSVLNPVRKWNDISMPMDGVMTKRRALSLWLASKRRATDRWCPTTKRVERVQCALRIRVPAEGLRAVGARLRIRDWLSAAIRINIEHFLSSDSHIFPTD